MVYSESNETEQGLYPYNETEQGSDPYHGLSIIEIKRRNYPLWAHQLSGLYLLVVTILGIMMNTAVLFTFKKNKPLRSPTNIFIIGMTISNLGHATLGNTLSWISALNGSWIAGDAGCTLAAFMVFAFGLTSLYQLAAVSIDRYIVICKPLLASKITARVAVLSVATCYMGGFMWALLPFTGWATYGLEAPGVSCGIEHDDHRLATMTYFICLFIFVYSLPLCTMIYCYNGVYSTVRQISKMAAFDKESRIAKKNLKVERKMLKTCVSMCMAFFVTWTPYAIVVFWGAFGNSDDIPLVITAIPAFVAKTEVIVNPVIYVGTNKVFRKAFYGSLPCEGLRDKLTKSEEEAKEQDSKETDPEEEEEEEEEEKKDNVGAEQGVSAAANAAENNGNPNAVAPNPSEPTKVEC